MTHKFLFFLVQNFILTFFYFCRVKMPAIRTKNSTSGPVILPKIISDRPAPYVVSNRQHRLASEISQNAQHKIQNTLSAQEASISVASQLAFIRKNFTNFLAHPYSASDVLLVFRFKHPNIDVRKTVVSVATTSNIPDMFSDKSFLANFQTAFDKKFPAKGWFRTITGTSIRSTFDLKGLDDKIAQATQTLDVAAFKALVCLFWGLVFEINFDGTFCACFPESAFELLAWNEALNLNCFKRSCQAELARNQASQNIFTGPCFSNNINVVQASLQGTNSASVFVNTLFGSAQQQRGGQ